MRRIVTILALLGLVGTLACSGVVDKLNEAETALPEGAGAEDIGSDIAGDAHKTGSESDTESVDQNLPNVQAPNFDSILLTCGTALIYKTESEDTDHSCDPVVIVGPSKPDKVTLEEPGQWTRDLAWNSGAGQWQSSPVMIDKTTTLVAKAFYGGEQVDQSELEIPVIIIEDNFQLNVSVKNKATQEAGVTLTPQNDYKDDNTIVVEYSLEGDNLDAAGIEEVCVRYPKKNNTGDWLKKNVPGLGDDLKQDFKKVEVDRSGWGLQSGLTKKVQVPYQVDLNLYNNFHIGGDTPSVTGSWTCFSDFSKSFEFELEGSTLVEYYAKKGDQQLFGNAVGLHYNITEPELSHEAELLNQEEPIIKYTYDFEQGSEFVLVTTGADVLQTNNPNYAKRGPQRGTRFAMANVNDVIKTDAAFNYENLELGTLFVNKEAECILGGMQTAEEGTLCADQDFVDDMLNRFEAIDIFAGLHVYRFKTHNSDGTYYIKPRQGVYDTKFLAFAYGYEGKKFYSNMDDNASVDAPNFSEFCDSSNKEEVFGELSAVASGQIYGVQELEVEFEDMTGVNGIVPDYSKGDGAWQGTLTGTYTGMAPKFKFSGTDMLGYAFTRSCAWGTIQVPDISLKILSSGSADKYNFEAKVEEAPGPRALTHWKIEQVSNHSCTGSDIGDVKVIDYVATADFEPRTETFTVNSAGVDCWKARLKVKSIDGTWSTLRWNAPGADNAVKHVGYTWSKVNSGGSQEIQFPPRLEFDWTRVVGASAPGAEGSGSACYYHKEGASWDDWDGGDWDTQGMALEFHATGKNVTNLSWNCHVGSNDGGSLTYPVNQVSSASGDFTSKRLLVEWRGEEHKVTITCSMTAEGVAGQSSNGGMNSFSWNCEVP